MPRFEITGADRDTGFEQTLRLDAKNEHEARAMAVMKLLSIAKVRRVELEDEVAKSLEGSAPQLGGRRRQLVNSCSRLKKKYAYSRYRKRSNTKRSLQAQKCFARLPESVMLLGGW